MALIAAHLNAGVILAVTVQSRETAFVRTLKIRSAVLAVAVPFPGKRPKFPVRDNEGLKENQKTLSTHCST